MITAIIQIRLNSSRLKRKALLKIQNLTLIEHLFSQLSYSTQIDKKIIATTTESIDNDIKKLANNIGIQCFRGDSLNVLDRYYNCAKSFDIDTIVRISGDAPLIDPVIVDKTIEYYKKNNFDYVSNFFRRTFPIGTEIEIFSFKTLEKCCKTAQQSYEKEHVTPFIYEHPELFNIGFIEHSENLSNLHWTVDRIEDFNFVEIILQKIKERPVSMNQILNLLKLDPDLLKINGSIDPLESFKKSKMNQ